MLGKLLKYEFKATARILLPMYAAILLFAGINKLFLELNRSNHTLDVVSGIAIFLYILVIIIALVLTIIVIIQRFYKNLLTDEGYLMFTLPVKPHMHVIAKGIVSFVWNIAAAIVVLASIFVLIVNQETLRQIPEFISRASSDIYNALGNQLPLLIVEIVIGIIAATVFGTLMLYASIAVGQLFSNHKILASFGTYIVLNIIEQIVSTVAMSFIGFFRLDDTTYTPAYFIDVFIPTLLILSVLFGVAYYFIINYIFTRKLNLD